ncbi:hypothetical protein V5E97_19980 [Singulisphaera sp. Ch08]|uniref:Uncharacterized protein n=1 Tax=Singulisphaera sp. Ch08 TaxID=3120278 RepID=A0AAU7CS98_9BACT
MEWRYAFRSEPLGPLDVRVGLGQMAADIIDGNVMVVFRDDMMECSAKCTDRAARPGRKQLCENIVSTQTREIGEMQTLLAWSVGSSSIEVGIGHGS